MENEIKIESVNEMIVWLIQLIAQEKKVDVSEIDAETPFVDLGLDSMSAVTLSGDIEMELDFDLSPTILWDYPNVKLLSIYLMDAKSTSETQQTYA